MNVKSLDSTVGLVAFFESAPKLLYVLMSFKMVIKMTLCHKGLRTVGLSAWVRSHSRLQRLTGGVIHGSFGAAAAVEQ